MKKFTAIEWQSFSLKKDIESIKKKLYDNRTIQLSLLSEVALVFLGFALPQIFSDLEKTRLFWLLLSILCIIPFIIIIINSIIVKIKEKAHGSDRINNKLFIDIFDNSITYYIFISESYYTMLTDALLHNNKNENKVPDNVIHFYYIQASYYFRKAICELVPINNIIGKVLSNKINVIEEKKLISLPRYYNASNLLTEIYNYIDSNQNVIKELVDNHIIIKLNENSYEMLKIINGCVNDFFKK